MNMILDFVNDVNTEIYHKTILIKAAALVDFFRKIRYSRIEITLKGGFTNDEKKSYDYGSSMYGTFRVRMRRLKICSYAG